MDSIAAWRAATAQVQAQHPFPIDAPVVLPDHLQAIWTLPPEASAYATRWLLIKANFSRQVPKGERITASRRRNGERGIWPRRYWQPTIRDDEDFRRPVD